MTKAPGFPGPGCAGLSSTHDGTRQSVAMDGRWQGSGVVQGVVLEVGKLISGSTLRRRWSARTRSGWPLHGWCGWWRVAAAALSPEYQGWHKWKPQATWMCAWCPWWAVQRELLSDERWEPWGVASEETSGVWVAIDGWTEWLGRVV